MATDDSAVGYGLPDGPEYPKEGAEDRDWAQYTAQLWDEQEDAMRDLFRVWKRNLLFLAGKHWHEETPRGNFRPSVGPSWREQPYSNYALAYFRNFLAKATKNRPAWIVKPASTEDDDLHSAELGNEVLEAKWVELRMARIIRNALSWTIATGNGFLYPYWNTDTGKYQKIEAPVEIPLYDDFDQPIIDEDGMQQVEERMAPMDENGEFILKDDGSYDFGADAAVVDMGDVGVRSYSPFQVRVNPEAEFEEDLKWMIIVEITTLRELRLEHGQEKVAKITPEDVSGIEDYMKGMGAGLTESGLNSSATGPDDNLEKVRVFHYHEAPSEEHPDGRYWVCTKDVMLSERGDLPEGIWPPMVHLVDLATPGRYFGSSTLEHVVPINKRFNELNAQIKEHHNLMVRGKWLVPKGSGIKKGAITNQPGEVIPYNPGFKPEQADIKPLPSVVYQERDKILQELETVSGIHRISMGRPPPGVTAGVAFLQLQEADDTEIGPFLAMLEESVAQLGGNILSIIKDNYHEDRLIQVTGENSRYQVKAFKGSDLEGVSDVVPQAGSSFPWNRMSMQSMMLTLVAQLPQLFQDPETGQFDQQKVARMLPMGGLDSIGQKDDLDVQEALREEDNFRSAEMGSMEVLQPEFWQNHDVHLHQHIRTLKSGAFRRWPEEAQQAFKAHVKATMDLKEQKARQMAQMQAMAQGNAPKELYDQVGAVQMDGQPSVVDEHGNPMMDIPSEGIAQEGWEEEGISAMPPPPAAGGGGGAIFPDQF